MTVRTRIVVLSGALACLLIAVEAQPVADSTRSDARQPRIQVSSQQVGVGNGTVTQAIDIKRQGTVPPAVTDANTPTGTQVLLPEDADSVPVYAIPWHSVNSGGARQAGGGGSLYASNSSVAQAATGIGASDNYEAGTGYWYGTDTTVICVCTCHADPACDSVTNVIDVVQAVNVAFRGWLPVLDPDCPRERTDVDCSGFTNVIDVVKFVNVAFRGGLPAVNFCDPCT